MSRPTLLCLILVVGLTFVITYANSSAVRGESTAPASTAKNKDDDDLFKDKVLIVELVPSEAADATPLIVNNARFTKIGGRDFMIGEGYVTEKGEEVWYDGMTIAIPSGGIARFESMTPERFKEYEKAIKEQTAN